MAARFMNIENNNKSLRKQQIHSLKLAFIVKCNYFPLSNKMSWRHRNDVSLYVPATSQVCLKRNNQDDLMKSCQDALVVRLHDVLLERCDDVSRGRNNDVPSARLHDISNKSQMKHPTTSQGYVIKMSQWYVSMTSH